MGEASSTHCWCQKTRLIALSCGIKTSAVHCFTFGFVTKHGFDRQLDGRTDGQNYDSLDHTGIAVSRDKNAKTYLLFYLLFSGVIELVLIGPAKTLLNTAVRPQSLHCP